MSKCSVNDCDREAFAKTWCRKHYSRMRLYGRLEKIQGIEKGTCKAEGCNNPIKGKGLCNNHYQMNRKYGRTSKAQKENKTKHPFYHLWFERKQNKDLCEAWLDFWKFVEDISPKPEGNYFLVKSGDWPYGPYNFKWVEKLAKEQDETDKEWYARKWEDRRIRNPEFDYDRNIQRKYGINIQKYNEMVLLQSGVCDICKRKETKVVKNKISRLCIDHCHDTGKIRGLLCFACNSTLGKFEDDVEYLKSMIAYLEKHKGT